MGIWIFAIIGALCCVALGTYAIGARVPEQHSVQASVLIPHQPPQVVAARIRDVQSSGTWRRGVSVIVLSRTDSTLIFEETGPDGTVTYSQTEPAQNREIVRKIINEDLPYGGSWTIRVAPLADGSEVTIQEDGFVKPPMFRFLAHFVFGYNKSIAGYLQQLAVAEASPAQR